MKNALLVTAGGLLGCVLSVALVLTGVLTPKAESSRVVQTAETPDNSAETSRQLGALSEENAKLAREIRSLRSSIQSVDDRLRTPHETEKARETEKPADEVKLPLPSNRASSEDGWLRLFIRMSRSLAYKDARKVFERKIIGPLNVWFRDHHTCVGAELETLMPADLDQNTWTKEDFQLTITGPNDAEIELTGDPETPHLKATAHFTDGEAPAIEWNKVFSAAADKAKARVSEARAACGALKDRARVVYQRTPSATIDMAALGISAEDLKGSYFTYADYSVSGTPEEFVVTCRNVFSDAPFDLICTCDIVNGQAKFNR